MDERLMTGKGQSERRRDDRHAERSPPACLRNGGGAWRTGSEEFIKSRREDDGGYRAGRGVLAALLSGPAEAAPKPCDRGKVERFKVCESLETIHPKFDPDGLRCERTPVGADISTTLDVVGAARGTKASAEMKCGKEGGTTFATTRGTSGSWPHGGEPPPSRPSPLPPARPGPPP